MPLVQANVLVKSEQSVVTDDQGNYTFINLTAGEYEIAVYTGFRTEKGTLHY
jgi:hypothetical protein